MPMLFVHLYQRCIHWRRLSADKHFSITLIHVFFIFVETKKKLLKGSHKAENKKS